MNEFMKKLTGMVLPSWMNRGEPNKLLKTARRFWADVYGWKARATGKTSAKKQTAGNAGQPGGQSAGEDEEKLTWFEKRVLKPVNDALG